MGSSVPAAHDATLRFISFSFQHNGGLTCENDPVGEGNMTPLLKHVDNALLWALESASFTLLEHALDKIR